MGLPNLELTARSESTTGNEANVEVRCRMLDVPRIQWMHESPFTPTDRGGVVCDESRMRIGNPYLFEAVGVWWVAVRRSGKDGDIDLYDLDI